MLDKLCVGMNSSAVAYKSTIYKVFLNKNLPKTELYIDWLKKMWSEASKNITLYFPWE